MSNTSLVKTMQLLMLSLGYVKRLGSLMILHLILHTFQPLFTLRLFRMTLISSHLFQKTKKLQNTIRSLICMKFMLWTTLRMSTLYIHITWVSQTLLKSSPLKMLTPIISPTLYITWTLMQIKSIHQFVLTLFHPINGRIVSKTSKVVRKTKTRIAKLLN